MTSTNFPVEHKGLFIHEYNTNDEAVKGDFFMVGHSERDSYIDEEEAMTFSLSQEEYQKILNRHGAKQYNHDIVYAKDDIKPAFDSYFETIEEAKNAIDELSIMLECEEKQVVILTDENNNYIPIAALIVSSNVSTSRIEEDIKTVKDSLPGKWTLSDIIDGISVNVEDMFFECISL